MVMDRQVRQLRNLLIAGDSLSRAAWKTGMDRKTARKYRDGKLPSERVVEHAWRTREDPFADVWTEVHEHLDENPGLQAKALFEWLQRKYPGQFEDGQLRTFFNKIFGTLPSLGGLPPDEFARRCTDSTDFAA